MKLQKIAKFVRMEGASDEDVKQALPEKLDDLADEAEKPGFDYASAAEKLEELAREFEDANFTPDEKEDHGQLMRRMATAMRARGFAGGAAPVVAEALPVNAAHDEPDGDEAEFARKFGIDARGMKRHQLFDAVSAAAVPAASIPAMVDAAVQRALEREKSRDAARASADRGRQLVDAAVAGGYPADLAPGLLRAASDPVSFDAVARSLQPFVSMGDPLFRTFTAAGAPVGKDARSVATSTDERVVDNELARFVVHGENFSNMAKEMADSKDPKVRARVDALLGETELEHAGLRLVAANRLLKQDRPDMWNAAEANHSVRL